MDILLPIIIIFILLCFVVFVILVLNNKKKKLGKTGAKKDKQALIREANKKLASDPHNVAGLKILADIYFEDQAWDKALPLYDLMLNIAALHPEVDQVEAGLRQGLCAIKLQKYHDSFKGLSVARNLRPDGFEVNLYLGQAFFFTGDFEKAASLLKKAAVLNPENIETYKFLGLALYSNKKFRESLPYLKKTLDNNPEDREILYTMAEAMAESDNGDKALKVFMHLRADPVYGARSSMYAGIIHSSQNQPVLAIQDFEIGLKHENIPPDVDSNIRYRLAQCYLQSNDIPKALSILKEIQEKYPGYKDVSALLNRYQELNQNKNLQIYLMANKSDFVVLCKKIVVDYFKKAQVKIIDLSVFSDYTEILTDVDTPKWQDTVIFRFYRTSSATGELAIRDFHSRIRETKCGQGICMSAGFYSEDARKFIEGRPIDLIDKAGLTKILNSID